jgi:ribonuclease R
MTKFTFSTTDIIKLLLRYKGLSLHEVKYHLALTKNEEPELKQLLKSMVSQKKLKIARDGIISLVNAPSLCLLQMNAEGRGGSATDLITKEVIAIAPAANNFAISGDEVLVCRDGISKDGHIKGYIQEIISHSLKHLVGRIEQYKDKYYLISENTQLGHYPVIIDGVNQVFNFNEIYHCLVSSYPSAAQSYFKVKVLRSLGHVGDDEAFVERVLIEANVPLEFSAGTMTYINRLPEQLFANEIQGRQDLRQLPFVTIDGEDARDFDDAVYSKTNPDGSFSLAVAIADVAHYVKSGSELDEDAYARSTSIYFPRRVVPMLPEKLSTGLCSLNPHVDRLVMVCHMEISPLGVIVNYSVANAIIHSHHRLTYTQVQQWIQEPKLTPSDIRGNIQSLYAVYLALLTARHKRGAIDFDSNEPYFKFDDQGSIQSLQIRPRLDSHKLIEECMLAANVAVADFLTKNAHATLYRNHARPSEKKFSALKDFLNSHAISFDVTQESVTPKDYANLVAAIKSFPDSAVIQQTILRSMQLAEYAPKNIGHFGLAYAKYLHFTSPIRRYPDLLVHRACKAVLQQKVYAYKHSIEMLGEQTSFCERRTEEMERKVDSYYKCKFAQSHIGNEYCGIISTVVSFGLFVNLPELLIEGLVHISELGGDYFIFDEQKHCLIGKNNGFKYAAGEKIQVSIAHVDMDKLFIDLELVQ